VGTIDQNAALLSKVARLHYQHGLAHHEVAEMVGLSRVKVTRLLAEARRTGVVEITVHGDEHLFVELETKLLDLFSLKRAWVGPSFTDTRADVSLGALGAQAVSSLLPESKIVAVGFSQSIANALVQMPQTRYPEIDFVPATGTPAGLAQTGSGLRLAMGFADVVGGRSYNVAAPLLASTSSAAVVLRSEDMVRQVLDVAAHADLLITGMGAMGADSRMLIDSLTAADLKRIQHAGGVGDLCARFFDRDGHSIKTPIDDKIIGLNLDQMTAIPTRLVIARGTGKVDALLGALRGGLMNALVTDTTTAQDLVEAFEAEDSAVPA